MKVFRYSLLAGLAGVLLGCGDSTGPKSLVGSYILQSVNGLPLPYVVQQTMTTRIEITGGQGRLNKDHTFSESLTSRSTNGAVATVSTTSYRGTYVQNGNDLTFTVQGGGTVLGSVSGNRVVFFDGSDTFVFTH